MREDWVECRVGDVFVTVTGNTPSKKYLEYYGNETPFVKPPDINNNEITNVGDSLSKLGKEKARILPIGSVLVTCIGNLGRIGLNSKFEVAFNQQINSALPTRLIYSKYTFYFFQNSKFKNELEKLSTSTTVALVNKSNFDTVGFVLSPLPEQRAIVKKIEELFSSLDAGIADLKKAQEQLKIYRQAVLKKAFKGELTKEWREKNNVDLKFELIKLNKLLIQSKEKHKPIKMESLFYVGLEHIERNSGKLTDSACNSDIHTIKNKFHKNQILYGKLRPYLNKVYLAKETGVCSTDILVFSPNEKISPKYALQFMLSRKFVNDMSNNTSGVNLPRVSTKYVENYPIPLPSIQEQHEIIKEIESRLSVCDTIEKQIADSLKQAETLRQSILKKAFEGKLLSQAELDICKQASDYEPAAILLERIKAEKEMSQPKKKTRIKMLT